MASLRNKTTTKQQRNNNETKTTTEAIALRTDIAARLQSIDEAHGLAEVVLLPQAERHPERYHRVATDLLHVVVAQL
jgi:hypothetical protein